jgi:hypothetical protein
MVNIRRSGSELIAEIEEHIADIDRLYTQETGGELHRIHFDRYIYKPLPIFLIKTKRFGICLQFPWREPSRMATGWNRNLLKFACHICFSFVMMLELTQYCYR